VQTKKSILIATNYLCFILEAVAAVEAKSRTAVSSNTTRKKTAIVPSSLAASGGVILNILTK
jgi:hypothetical protein